MLIVNRCNDKRPSLDALSASFITRPAPPSRPPSLDALDALEPRCPGRGFHHAARSLLPDPPAWTLCDCCNQITPDQLSSTLETSSSKQHMFVQD